MHCVLNEFAVCITLDGTGVWKVPFPVSRLAEIIVHVRFGLEFILKGQCPTKLEISPLESCHVQNSARTQGCECHSHVFL